MRRPVEAREPTRAAFPAWSGPAERLRFLLRHAILAPSRHNTQPWLFEIEGPELRIYGDWRRALRVADPQGRELAMACGAAALNVEVAALHHGHAMSLEVMDGSRKDGLLARLTLEERRAPTSDDEQLYEAIGKRRTNRLAFDGREVPYNVVTELIREAAREDAVLRLVDRTLRPAVAQLVAEGDRIQWASARYRAELATWTRTNRPGEVDGLPGYSQGFSDPASLLHRMLVRLKSGASADERRSRHYAMHTRALFALCTATDRPSDWFRSGRIMQRLLLRATAHGLCASYFSQAVEVPSVRVRLREAIGERGWPQLLFRLGYGQKVRATPRRPVDLVLRSMSTAAPEHAIVPKGYAGASS
jgi:nitroreductase